MTTPEGRVKKNIRRVLDSFGVYYLCPVQYGMGAAGVDFHAVVECCGLPIAFFIEAKKPGAEPTGRQDNFLQERREKQNARTFVIDDDPSIGEGNGGIEELVKWLEGLEEMEGWLDKPMKSVKEKLESGRNNGGIETQKLAKLETKKPIESTDSG